MTAAQLPETAVTRPARTKPAVMDAQTGLGEECDDGGTVAGDGCNATCQDETCGDGVLQTGLGEACDDGSINSTR